MLNPLKNLKKKLNHLSIPNEHVLFINCVANSIPNTNKNTSILDQYTIQQIKKLSSSHQINELEFSKFIFQFEVHHQQLEGKQVNILGNNLEPQQKKIVSLVQNFTNKLTSKQMLYLHYKIRQNINWQFPNWQNLHFNTASPSKKEILLMPTLSNLILIHSLKILHKNTVINKIPQKNKQKLSTLSN